MGKYNNPETLEQAKEIIKSQDELIGSMLRELNQRKDDKISYDQIRDKRKKEAGYSMIDNISFDIIWRTVLEKSKKYDELNQK